MTPAARLQMAIDILQAMEKTDQPADRLLKDWFRTRRFAGSKDRAAIGERVFAIQRHRSSLAWAMQDDSPRALVLASVARDGDDPDLLFTGQAYAPAALTEDEHRRLKAPRGETPLYVEGEFPAFLEPELTRAFGDRVLREMAALQARAPVDLRVNTLRRERGEVLEALVAQGFAATPTPYAPHGIRIVDGSAALGRTAMFESGAFEFQDEAAQIAAVLCKARPDRRILDLAAGAGGKSLALAALMRNEGRIVATDMRAAALQELERRAARAGATIIDTRAPDGVFDIVLLDAPCSGTGTWRRQPELRWRLTSERLEELKTTQGALLKQAAQYVKPGGRLVYATCSILPSENEDRIGAFLASHSDFTVVPAADVWRAAVSPAPPPGVDRFFRASPFSTGTDGFFAAVLQRPPG